MANPHPRHQVKFTPRRRALFLAELERVGIVLSACNAAGISRATAYRARGEDADFAEAWNGAIEVAIDKLEMVARERAENGVRRPLVSAGKLVRDDNGAVIYLVDYDSRLMELLLKAKRPREFGDRVQVAGDPAAPIVINVVEGDRGL